MKGFKCRGWSPDLNTWVYGAYYEHCTCAVCFSNEDKPEYHQTKIVFEQIQDWSFPYRTLVADVIPESVGAFTGCRLDGVEVYEGDVIVYDVGSDLQYYGLVKYGRYSDNHMGFYIDWHKESLLKNDFLYWMEYPNGHVYEKVKIVGNIYENPKLEEKVYGEDEE